VGYTEAPLEDTTWEEFLASFKTTKGLFEAKAAG
jgi:hypothetical protein